MTTFRLTAAVNRSKLMLGNVPNERTISQYIKCLHIGCNQYKLNLAIKKIHLENWTELYYYHDSHKSLEYCNQGCFKYVLVHWHDHLNAPFPYLFMCAVAGQMDSSLYLIFSLVHCGITVLLHNYFDCG